MNSLTLTGKLKIYDKMKGFGFITREKGKDVLVHHTQFIDKGGDDKAINGCVVEFELEYPEGIKGPRAINVKIIG